MCKYNLFSGALPEPTATSRVTWRPLIFHFFYFAITAYFVIVNRLYKVEKKRYATHCEQIHCAIKCPHGRHVFSLLYLPRDSLSHNCDYLVCGHACASTINFIHPKMKKSLRRLQTYLTVINFLSTFENWILSLPSSKMRKEE